MPLEIVRNDISSDIRQNRKNMRNWKRNVDYQKRNKR